MTDYSGRGLIWIQFQVCQYPQYAMKGVGVRTGSLEKHLLQGGNVTKGHVTPWMREADIMTVVCSSS